MYTNNGGPVYLTPDEELVLLLRRMITIKLTPLVKQLSSLDPPNRPMIKRVTNLLLSDYTRNISKSFHEMYDIVKDTMNNRQYIESYPESIAGLKETLHSFEKRFKELKHTSKYPQATSVHFSSQIVNQLPITRARRALGPMNEINFMHLPEASVNMPENIQGLGPLPHYPTLIGKPISRARSVNRTRSRGSQGSRGSRSMNRTRSANQRRRSK